jgi:hypothetical protein
VDKVVELVLEHARIRPQESLGVIALGVRHAERIDLALRSALESAGPEVEAFFADDAAEPFFVKNLERVQGDEAFPPAQVDQLVPRPRRRGGQAP